VVAAFAFSFALVMLVMQSVRPMSEVLQLTLFTTAQKQLALYGFVAMALMGSLYAILPRVTGRELPSPGLEKFNFWIMLAAVVIWTVLLALGGYQQGQALAAGAAFSESATKTLTFLRMSTLADLCMVVAGFAFFWNTTGLVCHACRVCCTAVVYGRKVELESAAKGARA
jgi:cbb3-type cytochrome oxidase subunit 1